VTPVHPSPLCPPQRFVAPPALHLAAVNDDVAALRLLTGEGYGGTAGEFGCEVEYQAPAQPWCEHVGRVPTAVRDAWQREPRTLWVCALSAATAAGASAASAWLRERGQAAWLSDLPLVVAAATRASPDTIASLLAHPDYAEASMGRNMMITRGATSAVVPSMRALVRAPPADVYTHYLPALAWRRAAISFPPARTDDAVAAQLADHLTAHFPAAVNYFASPVALGDAARHHPRLCEWLANRAALGYTAAGVHYPAAALKPLLLQAWDYPPVEATTETWVGPAAAVALRAVVRWTCAFVQKQGLHGRWVQEVEGDEPRVASDLSTVCISGQPGTRVTSGSANALVSLRMSTVMVDGALAELASLLASHEVQRCLDVSHDGWEELQQALVAWAVGTLPRLPELVVPAARAPPTVTHLLQRATSAHTPASDAVWRGALASACGQFDLRCSGALPPPPPHVLAAVAGGADVPQLLLLPGPTEDGGDVWLDLRGVTCGHEASGFTHLPAAAAVIGRGLSATTDGGTDTASAAGNRSFLVHQARLMTHHLLMLLPLIRSAALLADGDVRHAAPTLFASSAVPPVGREGYRAALQLAGGRAVWCAVHRCITAHRAWRARRAAVVGASDCITLLDG
jgi:hypothetical protein